MEPKLIYRVIAGRRRGYRNSVEGPIATVHMPSLPSWSFHQLTAARQVLRRLDDVTAELAALLERSRELQSEVDCVAAVARAPREDVRGAAMHRQGNALRP
jgi:hypothetical protein